MKKIKFHFTLRSSHSAATTAFSGCTSTIFDEEDFLQNINHLGYSIVSANVRRNGEIYETTVDFVDAINLADAKYFAEAFASLTTYYLSYNTNHYYGSTYIDIDFGEFYLHNGEGPGIRDHLSMNIERTVKLSSLPTNVSELHELVHFYFLGMQSNNIKAKFFNLFLILESIEASVITRSTFKDGTLFSDDDKNIISEVANKMGDNRKKAVLLSVLSRTDQSRHDKLHSVLAALGITQLYVLDDKATPVSVKLIKDLIEARNKLFHKGNSIDENLIWGNLIPITREIVKLLLINPKALSSD